MEGGRAVFTTDDVSVCLLLQTKKRMTDAYSFHRQSDQTEGKG